MNLSNRSVVVLGMARSGAAAARLLHRLGARVVVNDRKTRDECPEATELEKLGIPVVLGGHPDGLVSEEVDLLVKNPGIPYHAKPVQEALRLGIPVITEVEIAGWLASSPMIGITGSNGKTTTTTLVGEMLRRGGLKPVVAGNIGRALTEAVTDAGPDEWLVVELSSFQLKGTDSFRPRIAALLNVFPAHLDYHGSMDDYVRSKARIFANQSEEDIAVLNAGSEICRKIAESVRSRIVWFGRTDERDCGAFERDGRIIWRDSTGEREIMPVSDVLLRGPFNLENALAAVAIALSAGCPEDAIREALRTFRGVEHRLEFVTERSGIKFYNDSKATNPQAAIRALTSFEEPVVWIAGGLDRGIDFREMVPVIKERVRVMVVYGQTREMLAERGKDAGIPVHVTEDVREAARIAGTLARPGDVVLLSPACASWDQHASFEERGSIFKETVHSLQI
ncbi:UDP-N-acetylmuramoyl-L-alanine--D-glutamate ligase [Staphylospora marina]|uniref:UDP-N-acetylmuramoyl-L-alanine--D-glutamate ligase n=1 Tax=Staphylospora marina TaxID=2490858 RepID=UPI000F5BB6B6|nr:UDP-N-acetylmuramoyl-L-alanine--D-glutamate ligase [Staphylospora marina]